MEDNGLRDRVSKLSDADYAQQCLNLFFDIENEYWQKVYEFLQNAADGNKELDAYSLEWAQGLVRAAIEDLEKLDKVLEAKKELV